MSRAFNPSPHSTDELEAARSSNRNAKFGLAAAALSYLCKLQGMQLLMLTLCMSENSQYNRVHACSNVQHALLPATLAKCQLANTGYSTVQGPSSPLVRPHPAVWRLIHGIIVLYLISLIFLLFQDAHDARLFLKVGTHRNHDTQRSSPLEHVFTTCIQLWLWTSLVDSCMYIV